MLDQLLAKCASYIHFTSIVTAVDQLANAVKTSFATGSIEQEIADAISTMFNKSLTTPTPVAPKEPQTTDTSSSNE